MKKTILILTILFLILIVPFFIQAQAERELEIDYPEIGDWQPETVQQTVLPAYIRYIFTLSLAISGFIIFGILIYGGFRYLSSAGNPIALGDAKKQILAAFLGAIILLSSWLILTTIDPKLVIFDLPYLLRVRVISVPGIYLSSEESFPSNNEIEEGEKTVYHLTYDVSDLKTETEKKEIKSLKILNQFFISIRKYVKINEICPAGTTKTDNFGDCITTYLDAGLSQDEFKCCISENPKDPDFYYGAVLFNKKDMKDYCYKVYRSVGKNESGPFNNIDNPEPRSMVVFQETQNASGEVFAYTKADYKGTKFSLTITKPEEEWKELERPIKSIDMNGNFLLVLKDEGDKKCSVISQSLSDLKYFQKCNCHISLFGWDWCNPCGTHYMLFPTYSN